MRKFCDGVGVFDTDEAEVHELNNSESRPHRVVYELHTGDTWVMSERLSRVYKLSKLSYAEAAYYFTRYGKNIPRSLANRL